MLILKRFFLVFILTCHYQCFVAAEETRINTSEYLKPIVRLTRKYLESKSYSDTVEGRIYTTINDFYVYSVTITNPKDEDGKLPKDILIWELTEGESTEKDRGPGIIVLDAICFDSEAYVAYRRGPYFYIDQTKYDATSKKYAVVKTIIVLNANEIQFSVELLRCSMMNTKSGIMVSVNSGNLSGLWILDTVKMECKKVWKN